MAEQRANAILRGISAFGQNLVRTERRIDPFFRPVLDALFRDGLTALVQGLIGLLRAPEPETPATETFFPGESEELATIVTTMSAYLRNHYPLGHAQRAGNTKTHGVVPGRFVVADNLPTAVRHGLFAEPGDYPAWVRFGGPGPASPPDIDDVGVLSIGIKVMGVPGTKLLDDEKFTQDFTGITTPVFTTPDVRANSRLQYWIGAGAPLIYFLDPRDPHLLDTLMQGLWSRTQTSPLETAYFGCVPYLLGEGQAMRYTITPRLTTVSKVPNLPFRPPQNYLRQAMAATLAQQAVAFDFSVQLQTDPKTMPIENASVMWSTRRSPPIRVATLELPMQVFDTPAQLAFANTLSINPWHCLPAHRPLGNQNRARRHVYQALSALRQEMNGTPHREPTGDETFD